MSKAFPDWRVRKDIICRAVFSFLSWGRTRTLFQWCCWLRSHIIALKAWFYAKKETLWQRDVSTCFRKACGSWCEMKISPMPSFPCHYETDVSIDLWENYIGFCFTCYVFTIMLSYSISCREKNHHIEPHFILQFFEIRNWFFPIALPICLRLVQVEYFL